jgi:hypothetical protein
MKTFLKGLLSVALSFCVVAAQATCLTPLANKAVEGPPYLVSYTTGANNSCINYYLDTSGNAATFGQNILYSNTIEGPVGVGLSNGITAANTSNAIPVLVSTAIVQGMAIIATTANQTGFVNGVMSATSGQTSILGVADTAASSGTVVNVDYSGVSLALTTGTVTVGDLLVSTVTWPGYLVTNNSAAAGAIVGTALATQASTYNGLTRILVHH